MDSILIPNHSKRFNDPRALKLDISKVICRIEPM